MQDDGYVPPMTPDDFAALAEIAGPLYQQSKVIEAYSSANPVPNTMGDYWSNNIRRELEQAKHLVQASAARPTPVFVPPAPKMDIPPMSMYVPATPTMVPTETTVLPTKREDAGQLEFRFDENEQRITNELLREISRKLTRLITLVERSQEEKNVPKFPSYFPNDQV